jgi:hypothetical protein
VARTSSRHREESGARSGVAAGATAGAGAGGGGCSQLQLRIGSVWRMGSGAEGKAQSPGSPPPRPSGWLRIRFAAQGRATAQLNESVWARRNEGTAWYSKVSSAGGVCATPPRQQEGIGGIGERH